jgi:hypothetical protein
MKTSLATSNAALSPISNESMSLESLLSQSDGAIYNAAHSQQSSRPGFLFQLSRTDPLTADQRKERLVSILDECLHTLEEPLTRSSARTTLVANGPASQ